MTFIMGFSSNINVRKPSPTTYIFNGVYETKKLGKHIR
jgi:hypothetical protein